jgi:hypothetical protein
MLKTTALSSAKKTAGCAVTYRAGSSEKFGTCPASCELNPEGRGCGEGQIDFDYLDAVLDAKPRGGFSFTYSHFHPLFWAHKLSPEKTVINYSAADPQAALVAYELGNAPVVTVVKPEYWISAPAYEYELGVAGLHKYRRVSGVRIVRCPEEYGAVGGCADCGGPAGPLCARLNRDFIIGFSAHGVSKKKAATDDPGGCYAAGGNTALHWNATANQEQKETDAERLRAFVKTLPRGRTIRHHVAGDIGLDQ